MVYAPSIKIPDHATSFEYSRGIKLRETLLELISATEVYERLGISSENLEWYEKIKYRGGLKFLSNGVIETPGLSTGSLQGDKTHIIITKSGDIIFLNGYVDYCSREGTYTPNSAVNLLKTQDGYLMPYEQKTFEQQMQDVCFAYENIEPDVNKRIEALALLNPALFNPNYWQPVSYGYGDCPPF